MLVLSRRAQEQIRIGDDIVITVTKVAGNRTSIAIEAPREFRILRGELRDEPKENAA
jgi:carbon storage regulator